VIGFENFALLVLAIVSVTPFHCIFIWSQ